MTVSLTIEEFEPLNNYQFALTRQHAVSKGSATFINSSVGGSGAISSAGIASNSVADTFSAPSAISQTSSVGIPGAIPSAGKAFDSAACASSVSAAA
jgi:hypothetical protein